MIDPLPDWILVTLLDGYRKPFRPYAIITYGTLPSGSTYIDVGHGALEVRESEAEIARMVGSQYVGGVDTTPPRDPSPTALVLPKDIPFRRL